MFWGRISRTRQTVEYFRFNKYYYTVKILFRGSDQFIAEKRCRFMSVFCFLLSTVRRAHRWIGPIVILLDGLAVHSNISRRHRLSISPALCFFLVALNSFFCSGPKKSNGARIRQESGRSDSYFWSQEGKCDPLGSLDKQREKSTLVDIPFCLVATIREPTFSTFRANAYLRKNVWILRPLRQTKLEHLRDMLEKNESGRVKASARFASLIEQELTMLRSQLQMEIEQRQAEDDAIVDAMNRYTTKLQATLTAITSDE